MVVRSRDRAGHLSPEARYQFFVSETSPVLTVDGDVRGGKPFRLHIAPGPNTGQIVRYIYTYTIDGETNTVIPDADGTASIELTARANSFFTVSVSSLSANGWVSPATTWSQYVDTAPAVRSSTYPEGDVAGGGVGIAGTFTFAPRSDGVVSYVYSFDYGTPVTVPAGPDGTATVTWTPDTAGSHQLDVYAVAADGSESDTHYYYLNVNGS
ncbi:hypothetical protein [Micromonospora zhanjiangensis]|uniref:Ig-like domain (Group 3) n=1 Tax=Micromonospora zhanjiangensis TaxID=1522057 RepID=A0ABV8KU95_9ACTN